MHRTTALRQKTVATGRSADAESLAAWQLVPLTGNTSTVIEIRNNKEFLGSNGTAATSPGYSIDLHLRSKTLYCVHLLL